MPDGPRIRRHFRGQCHVTGSDSAKRAASAFVPYSATSQGCCAGRRTRDSCKRGFEVAAVGLEQAGEQPVRAPVFEPAPGPVAAEPDLEIAELVEHRGA
jgi:hypothetical protein